MTLGSIKYEARRLKAYIAKKVSTNLPAFKQKTSGQTRRPINPQLEAAGRNERPKGPWQAGVLRHQQGPEKKSPPASGQRAKIAETRDVAVRPRIDSTPQEHPAVANVPESDKNVSDLPMRAKSREEATEQFKTWIANPPFFDTGVTGQQAIADLLAAAGGDEKSIKSELLEIKKYISTDTQTFRRARSNLQGLRSELVMKAAVSREGLTENGRTMLGIIDYLSSANKSENIADRKVDSNQSTSAKKEFLEWAANPPGMANINGKTAVVALLVATGMGGEKDLRPDDIAKEFSELKKSFTPSSGTSASRWGGHNLPELKKELEMVNSSGESWSSNDKNIHALLDYLSPERA